MPACGRRSHVSADPFSDPFGDRPAGAAQCGKQPTSSWNRPRPRAAGPERPPRKASKSCRRSAADAQRRFAKQPRRSTTPTSRSRQRRRPSLTPPPASQGELRRPAPCDRDLQRPQLLRHRSGLPGLPRSAACRFDPQHLARHHAAVQARPVARRRRSRRGWTSCGSSNRARGAIAAARWSPPGA